MNQCLYRHFDKEGTLLYVGVSLRALNRLSQHRDHSAWFSSIVRVEMEHYPSREEACEAERIAIADENPKHNIIRATPKSRKKSVHVQNEEDYNDRVASLPELSRADLLRRMVNFSPLYDIDGVAAFLGVGRSAAARLIGDRSLGHVRLPNSRGTKGYHVRVTGWQLVDYIEVLQAEAEAEADLLTTNNSRKKT